IRPEGPECNSRGRTALGLWNQKLSRPKGRHAHYFFRLHAAPAALTSYFSLCLHALTGVAIYMTAFGPNKIQLNYQSQLHVKCAEENTKWKAATIPASKSTSLNSRLICEIYLTRISKFRPCKSRPPPYCKRASL